MGLQYISVPKRAAVALVHDPCGHVLCVWNKMAWSLPGGKLERGETATDAVVRELREETGLWANYLEPLYEGPGSLDPNVTVSVFRVFIRHEEPRQMEADSPVKWASIRWLLKNAGPYAPFYKRMFQLLGRASRIAPWRSRTTIERV